MVSEPPRPSVVMSFLSWLTPWNPATIAMLPSSSAVLMRPGVTSMMRALLWTESVITPAWLPVKLWASWPRFLIAMASRAMAIRSPAVSSMSNSRPAGIGDTCSARSISSSVVSPIADTTTTTWWPSFLASTIRLATRLMPSASATEEPPYFCTTRPTCAPRSVRLVPHDCGRLSLTSGRIPPRGYRIVRCPAHVLITRPSRVRPYGRPIGRLPQSGPPAAPGPHLPVPDAPHAQSAPRHTVGAICPRDKGHGMRVGRARSRRLRARPTRSTQRPRPRAT